MNLMELLYVMVALGVGAGLALSLGQHHGMIGAILGFVGGVTGIFALLGIVTALLRWKRKETIKRAPEPSTPGYRR